jgi:hypothetical protein
LKRILLSIFTILFGAAISNAGAASDSIDFFRSERVYRPIEAGILEARTGFQKYTNTDYLKLDIGVSIDVVSLISGNHIYSAGVDFFTFSNLRSEENFKFPVDAIDYFFGINLNFQSDISKDRKVSARFRLSHISSHLEDGHVYERTDTIFTPFVFSKEFVDVSAIYEYNVSKRLSLRGQGGFNYIFHSIPDEISPLSGQIGLEAKYFVTDILSLYISNEVTIAEVSSNVSANENLETGVTLGKRNSRGISFYFNYYDGQDYRGQYYGDYLNTKGLGVKINF